MKKFQQFFQNNPSLKKFQQFFQNNPQLIATNSDYISMRPLRDITPGKVHLLTCRTRHSELLLVPSSKLNNCIGGVIAKYAEVHKIKIYSLIILSNHYHLLISGDNISLFAENINREIAKRVNYLIRRKGSLWGRRFDDQIVVEQVDDLEALLYVNTNPVKHGLVCQAKSWPGLSTYWQVLGEKEQEFTFLNYTKLNKARNKARATGEIIHKSDFETKHILRVTPIPMLASLSKHERTAKIKELLDKRVRKLTEERRQEGKGFLGRKAILEQPQNGTFPAETSKSNRPYCYSKSVAVIREFRAREKARRAQYTEISIKYRSGDNNLVFPECCFYPPRHHKPKAFPYFPT